MPNFVDAFLQALPQGAENAQRQFQLMLQDEQIKEEKRRQKMQEEAAKVQALNTLAQKAQFGEVAWSLIGPAANAQAQTGYNLLGSPLQLAGTFRTSEEGVTERTTRPAKVRTGEAQAGVMEARLDQMLKSQARIDQLRSTSPEIDELFTFFEAGAGAIKVEELQQKNRLALEQIKQEFQQATGSTQADIARRMLVGQYFDVALTDYRYRLNRRLTEIANAQLMSQNDEKDFAKRMKVIDQNFPEPGIEDAFGDALTGLREQGVDLTVSDLQNYTRTLGFGQGSEQATATPPPVPTGNAEQQLDTILQQQGSATKALQYLKKNGATENELKAAREYYNRKR